TISHAGGPPPGTKPPATNQQEDTSEPSGNRGKPVEVDLRTPNRLAVSLRLSSQKLLSPHPNFQSLLVGLPLLKVSSL
ncbi:hypothetical protein, partial [Hydrocoleum sp. CS-953]|uniref:hypothetical protein n=1 Tax=Hydrocoleum sp. CS-953 TaxID=1671698 RepID=UPI001AF00484